MKNIRVLVFSASYGAGHIRAAEAIIDEIKRQNPDSEITHMDWGVLLSQTLNKIIKDTYLGMIKYVPKLWGKIYYDTAKISPDSSVQKLINNLGESSFLEYIDSINPDFIVCTYPVVAGLLAQLRLKHALNIPIVTIVTDYTMHAQWVHRGVDLYIVACDDLRQAFISKGIDPGRIQVTGIPVSYKFELQLDRQQLMTKFRLEPNRLTFLIMGGAYGVLKGFREICKMIQDMPLPCQIIVVCGRNKRLYKSLDDIMQNGQNPLIRYGFVKNIEELMTVSDMIITKAGGLIVSEALTKRLPLIIYKPIPGQEEQNANYLSKIGAGRAAHSLEDLNNIIYNVLEHPEEMEKMRQAAAQALPGRAAEKAVMHMMKLINKKANS